MKKLWKPLISVVAIGAFTLSVQIGNSVFANNDSNVLAEITNTCEYDSKSKVNPSFTTMNCLLTETALKYDVPPEIVKAIAEGESGNWRHFDSNGEAIVTSDNGIGVMQVTNQTQYDTNELKNNVAYNVKAGVEILDSMFLRKDLPVINDGSRDVLEHWYFAVMAYNGIKPKNSPVVQATGVKNTNAYQEKIFALVKEFGLISLVNLPFSRDDFKYDPNSNENIKFITMKYHFDLPLTNSKHYFEVNQKVSATTNNVRIRTQPNTGSGTKGYLQKGDSVTITGPFVYDVSVGKNHFVWYPVKRNDGTTGYVASSYLNDTTSTPEPITFKDVPNSHYAKKAIYYLAERDILKGVGQGKFGLGQGLKRWQAVLLINRANNVSDANRPNPGFKDVPKTHKYYKEIAAAVDEGLFQGTSSTEFKPDKIMTRSEMAEVLQRIYKFPAPSSKHPFTDVKKGDWFADSVARLYASGITDGVTKNEFKPKDTIKREQFALFLARSMDESFRTK